jgi:amino acid transporter
MHLDSAGALQPASIMMIAFAMPQALFAYNGYQLAICFGEEVHDARKRIGRVVLWALVLAVVTEAVPMTAILLGMKTWNGSSNVILDFVRDRGGNSLAIAVGLAVALAQFNANIACTLVFARLIFSSGRDQTWNPTANGLLTQIHHRFNSPWMATLFCGLLASAACFINFNALLILSGSSMIFIYGAICCVSLASHRNGINSHGYYRMPFFPLPPLAALAAFAYIIYATYLDKAVGRPSLYATAAMIAGSAAYYFLILQPRGRWVLRGPSEPPATPLPVEQL